VAIKDCAAPGGQLERLPLLLRCETRQRLRHDALKPDRASQRPREREREQDEEQPDATVDDFRGHRRGRSSTYVGSAAGRSPSFVRASRSILAGASVLDTFDSSSAFCASSSRRCWPSFSICMFSRSTATLTATTPTSSTASSPIHTTPPA